MIPTSTDRSIPHPADPSSLGSVTRAPLAQLLETLRLTVHLAFAVLLVVTLLQFFADPPSTARLATVSTLSGVLAVVYVCGTVWENRYAGGRTRRDPGALSLLWLAVVLGLWVTLVALTADAVWLLFPLVFIILALTGPVAGTVTVAVCWAVVAVVPLSTGQRTGIGGVVGPAIGVLFAGVTYWTYRRLTGEAEHHRQIAEQLVATRDRLLAAENQAGRLAERERLTREIHDTLAQGFNSVLLLSRAARTALDQGRGQDAADQLSVITTTAHDNLVQTRALVAGGARPDSVPLTAALRQLAQDATRRARALGSTTAVDTDVEDVPADGAGLPAPVAGALLRVAQEAVANAVDHAGASRIRVTLGVWDTEATLDVFDDGHGFDPGTVQRTASGGYGLTGMRRRMTELGGEFTVDSSPSGTVVAVRVPTTQENQ